MFGSFLAEASRGRRSSRAAFRAPPFSIAGKQLGQDDERDLFPTALRLAREIRPTAVLLENVPGITSRRFAPYLASIIAELEGLGFVVFHRVLHAASFGVPQLRPRFVLVAIEPRFAPFFVWPEAVDGVSTVGQSLADMMAEGGWPGAAAWAERACSVAPTLVGGSKLHGGADLGPTRAKAKWATMGVDAKGISDAPPPPHFPANGTPKLTVRMAARLQGFPDSWRFSGGKTAAYRQVANAFPPPVAEAVGRSILRALAGHDAAPEAV